MKILGYQHKDLSFTDGRSVSGFFLYIGEKNKNTVGIQTDRVFVSDAKMNGYIPKLDDEIKLYYNKYGKVDAIDLV